IRRFGGPGNSSGFRKAVCCCCCCCCCHRCVHDCTELLAALTHTRAPQFKANKLVPTSDLLLTAELFGRV
ncbi:hypothetical protein IE81DRAFT_310296, partial [Ceraceosorus guamensis]